ncbi:unnamed protein product [Fraxinus pennsylvanica]|uniref:Uncharacterized protein n=1 Tax=Fraxinus pennsylvanica TaxID=56036 RepID=A0AAD2DYQ3_9LAMI|nr:unnamed protein product [Fraxinus pennsylvanica]
MLNNQKDAMEDSVEIVIEKLLHLTKDSVSKVSNEVQHCLSIMLTWYDAFRCLSVIVPLLATEDERSLLACIKCLTKIVSRHSQEELMALHFCRLFLMLSGTKVQMFARLLFSV